jgi:hypothetical protein
MIEEYAIDHFGDRHLNPFAGRELDGAGRRHDAFGDRLFTRTRFLGGLAATDFDA